jgi:hypothetical protein
MKKIPNFNEFLNESVEDSDAKRINSFMKRHGGKIQGTGTEKKYEIHFPSAEAYNRAKKEFNSLPQSAKRELNHFDSTRNVFVMDNSNYKTNESKKINIEDIEVGDILHFEDGEAWIAVKPGLRSSNNRKGANEVTARPYNKLAKDRNISLPIDFTIDYINDTLDKLEKK